MTDSDAAMTNRWWAFSAWIVLSSLLFIKPVIALFQLSLSQADASYLVSIPLFSAVVLYLERPKTFQHTPADKVLGGAFLLFAGAAALIAFFLGRTNPSLGLQPSGLILALVLFWVAGFAFLFGKAALQAAPFPFLFLILMVPIPPFVLNRITLLLQEGSAWITGEFFDIFGVPVLRQGLVFHLARVNIEVARECSGIRSSMALFILALLVAHFLLKNFWNKILFIAVGLLMMIIKNGIRIATLTLLAIYVDPGFLLGRLHHEGGVVFFLLALLLLWPLLFFLQRLESNRAVPAEAGGLQSRSA